MLWVPGCRSREIGAHVLGFSGAVHGGYPVASTGKVLSRVARLARALPAEDESQAGIIQPLEPAFPITVILIKVGCRVGVAHNDVTQRIAHVTPQRRSRAVHGVRSTPRRRGR